MKPLPSPSATRAAARIDDLYPRLEPRLGVRLTDPNVILTLADTRGQTEFFIRNPLPADADAFDRLSRHSQSNGIRFKTSNITSASTGEPTLMVSCESLPGLARNTAQTRLPGIEPIDPGSGWRGVDAWRRSVIGKLRQARGQGHYPSAATDQLLGDIAVGVIKGYPDEAVMASLQRDLLPPADGRDLPLTKVPYADYYRCAQPNYMYDPADRPVIDRHTAGWGRILQEYYECDAHKRLAAEKEFQAARKAADNS